MGKAEGTHGDGGSGKKKHCYRCDSFHDFAVGEHDLGILLGDHVKALSQHNCQLSRISHHKHQRKGHNIFLRPWGGGGAGEEKGERIRSPYQINDVLHSLLHTLHPDLAALKLCYFLR